MNNQQFEIRNTKDKGKGLFSFVHFDKNQILFRCDGKLLTEAQVNILPKEQIPLVLQVNANKYLDLNGDNSLFCNHSCNPNTAIKLIGNKAFLIAIMEIKPNDEICFDYSITSTDAQEEWSMICKCGSWNCRKQNSGFQYMPEKDVERYAKLGLIPKYLIK